MTGPLDYFQRKNGILQVEDVALSHIAQSTGTPVYVYSANGIRGVFRGLAEHLSGLDALICFAVKANSNLSVLKLLSSEGAGVDVVSGGELYRAQKAGVPPKKIVFSGVGKSESEITEALSYGEDGIFSFNVESAEELDSLSAIATRMRKKARIAFRFNPDVDPRTHPYISTGLKKNKFGLSKKEILALVKDLPRYPGVSLRGLSIHIGSQLTTLTPLDEAFGHLVRLSEAIEAVVKSPLAYLDVGGGLGISYGKEKTPSIEKYVALLKKHFGPKRNSGPGHRILLEPGRLIVGNAGALLTKVLYRKKRAQKDFLIVDAGMNDLIRPSLYGSFHEIVPVEASADRGAKRKTDVVGPVCESADCFATGRPLSARLNRGDLLAILSAGAYGFAMSGQYNSRPRPPEVLVDHGTFEIIRARETYEDLIRGENR